jgi:hypothetical protein
MLRQEDSEFKAHPGLHDKIMSQTNKNVLKEKKKGLF